MVFVQLIIMIVAAGLAFLAARGALITSEGEVTGVKYIKVIEAAAILIVGFLIVGSFGEIPAGHRGVVLRFGATTGEVKQPGFYTVIPFINTVHDMDVQVQAYSTDAAAASLDLQNVTTKVTLNYSPDPTQVADLYSKLGDDYENRIIAPAIQEATKATTARYTAEELITKRQQARDELEKLLKVRLSQFDLDIEAMSITNFEFSQEFTQAIEAKVVAFQNYLQSQNVLKQRQVEAQQAIALAQGDAQANRLRRQQITPLTVQYDAVQKWDGHLPSVTGGGIPLLNLGALQPSEKP